MDIPFKTTQRVVLRNHGGATRCCKVLVLTNQRCIGTFAQQQLGKELMQSHQRIRHPGQGPEQNHSPDRIQPALRREEAVVG